MARIGVRACEYCHERFRSTDEQSSFERFCSIGCLEAAWAGGNPHVMAVDAEGVREYLVLPHGSDFAVN